MKPHVLCHTLVSLDGRIDPSRVDDISLLVAPAIDGALGITGVFEVPGPAGLVGEARLRFLSSEPLEHGLVHLRYAVEAT